MAGLYDDLPEPAAPAAAPAAPDGPAGSAAGGGWAPGPKGPRPPPPGDRALLFRLDDASVHLVLAYLPVRDAAVALAAVCQLLRWLREAWPPWGRWVAPLRRRVRVRVARLAAAAAQSVEDLARRAGAIEAVALEGFGAATWAQQRLLGGVGDYAHCYGELPMPRVLWSLHTEGLTAWRGVCSMVVDAGFAVLPPWHKGRRRSLLPPQVRLVFGVSLWLPPEGVDADHSFPQLYLNAALEEAAAFQAVAAAQPEEEPPCVAANCEAVLFRPGGAGSGRSLVVEEWGLRFCFAPRGFRHRGHGETDGYNVEAYAGGRRRWRPPDLCYAPAGERPPDDGLHLLLRARRCEGLLD